MRVRGARGRMHLKTRVGATDIARNHKLLTSHHARYPKRRQSADVSNGVPQSSIGRFAVDGGRAQQQDRARRRGGACTGFRTKSWFDSNPALVTVGPKPGPTTTKRNRKCVVERLLHHSNSLASSFSRTALENFVHLVRCKSASNMCTLSNLLPLSFFDYPYYELVRFMGRLEQATSQSNRLPSERSAVERPQCERLRAVRLEIVWQHNR